MPQPRSKPAAQLTPATHAALKALADRWRTTPVLHQMRISNDMLIHAALALLAERIPWDRFTGTDLGQDVAALETVMRLSWPERVDAAENTAEVG